ncbi:DUF397 domain-containing protein [Actinomadura madurae]|uniref:DUF397 domain-containing protein n=1 Tax=Actinomadura madurae TaxID=1993 RepID=UPI002026DFC0|nr:DUF397 domain-containing protein [Actinomadura madurae]MCP9955466.1 DUF397 domain-containing protein [Actinomadura madurae]MCP9972202.1 DUF397 domain-containing protein [Actinomadura madurae]MCP9984705.1 DUF397 domain-containing protein [Actinomadura madurae]MCQ0003745.1 DUF397 domain-containing protein [Actinomadura madurae]MCQ0020896.1 DUF397 domain-containing protein [Actinomadura madurae]
MDGSPAQKIVITTDVRPHVPEWRRSSRCAAAGTCVEVAAVDGLIFVRDSGNNDDTVIPLTPHAWRELLVWLRNRS